MRTLSIFEMVSVDGFFCDAKGDMSWAHRNDPEWTRFTQDNASGGAELLFGRKTYEMMARFWPTPAAAQAMPAVAERMNALPKVVFSRTLAKAEWANTRLVKGDLASEVREMKALPGKDLLVMGSGSIVSQLTAAGLIDEMTIVVVPTVIGKGRTLFEGVEGPLGLALRSSKAFGNGNVVLTYARA